jgi:hypothetical protein
MEFYSNFSYFTLDPTPCTICPVDQIVPTYYNATLIAQSPAISLVKSAAVSGSGQRRCDHVYITVTNTGNTTLSNVVVSDPMVGLTGDPIATLAAGRRTTASRNLHYYPNDIDAGKVTNSALVKQDRNAPDISQEQQQRTTPTGNTYIV